MHDSVFKVGDQVLIPIEWVPGEDFGMTAGIVLQVRTQNRGRNFSYVVEIVGCAMTLHVAQEDCLDDLALWVS